MRGLGIGRSCCCDPIYSDRLIQYYTDIDLMRHIGCGIITLVLTLIPLPSFAEPLAQFLIGEWTCQPTEGGTAFTWRVTDEVGLLERDLKTIV